MPTKSTLNKVKNLHQKKFRERFGEFIVEGIKGVVEAINSDAEIYRIFATEAVLEQIKIPTRIEKEIITEKEGRQISDAETFSGILAVVAIPNEVNFSAGDIICMDRMADPGNLGTIIRTADWFGIKNILLSENCVDPYNPKVVRSTMGSIFRVNIMKSAELVRSLEELKNKGYNIISLTMDGKDISELKIDDKKNIYVFGSESHGVRDDIVQMGESYAIFGKGSAESLNVAVAAGIVLNRIVNP
ncbi:MAG: RNA methyltransferase [Patescibacteria group bacterium]